jgi:hypothetical protein
VSGADGYSAVAVGHSTGQQCQSHFSGCDNGS